MESLATINKLSSLLLIIINVGCVFRILFCCVVLMHKDVAEGQHIKNRILYTLLFLAVANSLGGLNAIAQIYWG